MTKETLLTIIIILMTLLVMTMFYVRNLKKKHRKTLEVYAIYVGQLAICEAKLAQEVKNSQKILEESIKQQDPPCNE